MKRDQAIPSLESLLLIAEQRLAGEKQAVAKAIGVTPSRYSRLRSGEGGGMQAENLFRLARLIDRDPSTVLRAGGRHDLATCIEEAYGGALSTTATPQTDELLGLYALIATDPEGVEALLTVSRSLARLASPHAPLPPPAPPLAPPRKRR